MKNFRSYVSTLFSAIRPVVIALALRFGHFL